MIEELGWEVHKLKKKIDSTLYFKFDAGRRGSLADLKNLTARILKSISNLIDRGEGG